MKGKLIVLTGIDGSGKTVQTKLLYDRLKNEGFAVETIDFPQYGKTLFADLASRYLRGEFGSLKDVDPHLAAILFAGDRFEAKVALEGWLDEGKVVIANRYVCDNIAHQGVRVSGGAMHANMYEFASWLTRLEYSVYGLPRSSLNIFLSIPPKIAYKLIAAKAERAYLSGSKRDIHESDLNYLENASAVFRILATTQPNWEIVGCVDGNGNLLSELDISEKVWNCVGGCLRKDTTTLSPGTMAALRVVDNWDGQRTQNYALAEWSECDGEMQWCYWPGGGRVVDYDGDEILDVWVLKKHVN